MLPSHLIGAYKRLPDLQRIEAKIAVSNPHRLSHLESDFFVLGSGGDACESAAYCWRRLHLFFL